MAVKKKATKKRIVSDTHKAAMATGREMSRAVDAYLKALDQARPKRGRRVNKDELEKRLTAAHQQASEAAGTARLLALQLVTDLEDRIKSIESSATGNMAELETAFAKAAKSYSESKGIAYGTWRAAGVPAALLKRAGISR